MPRLNKKIGDAQRDVSAINGNFDNVALDLADARGVFSTSVETGGLLVSSVGPNNFRKVELNVLDVEKKYNPGKLPAFLRYTMYLDTNNDGTRIWPIGTGITGLELGTFLVIPPQQQFFTLNPVEDEKATITFAFANFDAVDHTVYLYLDVFYMPGPDLGIALRAENV